MSELKEIAAILFKNLSDAFLQTASEISKLDRRDAPPKLSQADDSKPILDQEKSNLITHFQYQPREKVLVIFDGSDIPTKCKILKRLDASTYLVVPQRSPKSMAREIQAHQIIGLDPDR